MTSRERLQALSSALIVVAVGAILLVLGTVLFLAVQDHQRIRQNEEIQAFIKEQAIANGRTGRLVEDCTTPGNPCYERAAQQTAKAVADINRVSIYAAACADRGDVQSVEEIQQCVITRLAKDLPPR